MMERIDWEAIRVDGTKAFLAALEVLERNQETLDVRIDVLRTLLPLSQRLETVWFRRYSEVMGVLWRAGMPAELEGEQVGEWLRARLGGRTAGNGTDGARGRGLVDTGDGENDSACLVSRQS